MPLIRCPPHPQHDHQVAGCRCWPLLAAPPRAAPPAAGARGWGGRQPAAAAAARQASGLGGAAPPGATQHHSAPLQTAADRTAASTVSSDRAPRAAAGRTRAGRASRHPRRVSAYRRRGPAASPSPTAGRRPALGQPWGSAGGRTSATASGATTCRRPRPSRRGDSAGTLLAPGSRANQLAVLQSTLQSASRTSPSAECESGRREPSRLARPRQQATARRAAGTATPGDAYYSV